jgi:hypothetical protein
VTGAPSKKPWWVSVRGRHSRAYTLFIALALTITAGSGLFTSLRNGNWLFAAISIVGVVLAFWLWAVVFWEQRHRGDAEETNGVE